MSSIFVFRYFLEVFLHPHAENDASTVCVSTVFSSQFDRIIGQLDHMSHFNICRAYSVQYSSLLTVGIVYLN